MSDIDELIRKRLENLRADDPSYAKASTSSALPKLVKKSAPEQVEDLLGQLSAEAELHSRESARDFDVDSHIRARLERLKSREGCEFIESSRSSVPKSASRDELADEEFFEKSSCRELLTDLGVAIERDDISDCSDASSTLCGVCDENKPSLICVDCDKDYYCYKCFKEYHSDDEEQHKTVPYAKK